MSSCFHFSSRTDALQACIFAERALRLPWILSPAREVMESGTITSTTLHWHASSHPCTLINSLFSFFLLLFLVCHKQRLSFFRFLSSLVSLVESLKIARYDGNGKGKNK